MYNRLGNPKHRRKRVTPAASTHREVYTFIKSEAPNPNLKSRGEALPYKENYPKRDPNFENYPYRTLIVPF